MVSLVCPYNRVFPNPTSKGADDDFSSPFDWGFFLSGRIRPCYIDKYILVDLTSKNLMVTYKEDNQ